jgi:hypothetical protein
VAVKPRHRTVLSVFNLEPPEFWNAARDGQEKSASQEALFRWAKRVRQNA